MKTKFLTELERKHISAKIKDIGESLIIQSKSDCRDDELNCIIGGSLSRLKKVSEILNTKSL